MNLNPVTVIHSQHCSRDVGVKQAGNMYSWVINHQPIREDSKSIIVKTIQEEEK